MPAARPPRNRGPAAAAANRAAILDAARRLFAERGYRVPLSAIATAAGVGQAVLYRHFPARLELAYAVFAANFAELESLAAAHPGPECFGLLWQRLVAFTIDSSAFVEMVIDARTEMPDNLDQERLSRLVAAPLRRAQDAGLADPAWTPADVQLLLHMVYGVAISSAAPAAPVHRALTLIDPRLAPA